ncbi:HPP family protein [Hymenobacter taeanensis]|uniref:HPP family protein n=1 Tax=Hymenobacter taeanensis TaxID=2735321 RepID=A0A6M6BPJ8_9BACT|nr:MULTISPECIES: HPP family protein [Hymenobacter]QJX48915.1 HPP family protein [Hymenobacter taeanensis]UOQ81570.1 HPP family protein [Hymenobacter sp. 5414T-23]
MPDSQPLAAAADALGPGRPRLRRKGELLLALLPTATVLLMLWLLELLSNQRLLFAALASSAFLIYLDPGHHTNSTRTLVVSQMGAAAIGFALHAWMGPGYVGAAASMVLTIGLMIGLDAMHPPAVGTALNFAFRAGGGEGNLLLFGLAVGLVVVLVIVQRGTVYLLKRLSARPVVST